MKKIGWIGILLIGLAFACNQNKDKASADQSTMMVRMAEIEIAPEHLEDYLAILKEESEASVRLEHGVICIYPMYLKENPTEIRLLEIYASKAAYDAHLQTPHFKQYKTTTLPMVKTLKLLDMEAIDPASMPEIFAKLNQW